MAQTNASLSEGEGMPYYIEERRRVEAPELTADQLMTITEAAEALSTSASGVNNLLGQGRLTTVFDTTDRTAFLRPRRLVLRREVEALIKELATM
jgi:hypothetical protein